RKKRILFFLPLLNGGGAERVVLTLLQHIDRTRFEPVLVLLKKEGHYIDQIPENTEVIDLQASQARKALWKIIKIIHTQKPDTVFTTLSHLNLIIAILRPFLSRKVTFIARESNTVSVRNRREKYPRLFDWLYRHVYQNFDLIVTQAEFMKNDLIQNYGIAPEKMVVIYNPVDAEAVMKQSEAAKADLPQGVCNLLAVGKLGYQKGFDLLLQSISKLDERYHLTILGEGTDRQKLQQLIARYRLHKRVTLAGFAQNPYTFMKQADLLVLSSRFEGLPNVVLEANALGTPVVAFDAPGGTGEIVHENKNGFLVTPFDTEAFARAIEKACGYPFDHEAIQRDTAKEFGIDKIIKSYEKILG
ncbi:MAG: hypothetical protein DSZ05_03580, partial [Sulfurospirillum sp.]